MIGLLLKVIKKILKYVFAPLFVIAHSWVTYFLLLGNFHTIEKHQIRSIINLRG